MKRTRFLALMLVSSFMFVSLATSCNKTEEPDTSVVSETTTVSSEDAIDETTEACETEETSAEPTATPTPTPWPRDPSVPDIEGYNLLWADEFNGDELDETLWSVQTRRPGVTNNELQAYVDSDENVYVENGCLCIRATREIDEDGNVNYYSGKVDGRNKTDFMYGRVEVRARVPEGQGFWPAIWMMPTVENRYGSWPQCGEIDIMEILGHEPQTTYGTLHWGVPHGEQQGSLTLEEGSFATDFHVFSAEWEPGEIRYYVDDILINTCNDWFSAMSGGFTRDYPAPFNQLFYLQLNLAVGGNWPGDPDETTNFDNAVFEVDYVRVYQLPEYDENVTRPEAVFRDPDSTGNYVINGDLSDDTDDLADLVDWSLILNQGGSGDASIDNGVLRVNMDNVGDVDYSIQLANWDIPLVNGEHYVLTFDARADEDRTTNVCITGPRVDYIRYLQDTEVSLGTDWQTYTYEFDMTEESDAYARLEFNMGATDSSASIEISNVRIEIQ